MKQRHIFLLLLSVLWLSFVADLQDTDLQVMAKKKKKKAKAKKSKDSGNKIEEIPAVSSPKRPNEISEREYCWAC